MVKTKLLKNEEKQNWIYGISFVLQALKNAFIRIEKMCLLSKIETNMKSKKLGIFKEFDYI